jgi:hypothetical protein
LPVPDRPTISTARPPIATELAWTVSEESERAVIA